MNALRVDLMSTGGREYDGARCELPAGEVVEASKRRTPLYDLARKLDALGYGDWRLQSFTPTGTPSLRGLVKVLAGRSVEERRDRGGLRLTKFRPFSADRSLTDRREAVSGIKTPDKAETGLCEATEEAA